MAVTPRINAGIGDKLDKKEEVSDLINPDKRVYTHTVRSLQERGNFSTPLKSPGKMFVLRFGETLKLDENSDEYTLRWAMSEKELLQFLQKHQAVKLRKILITRIETEQEKE